MTTKFRLVLVSMTTAAVVMTADIRVAQAQFDLGGLVQEVVREVANAVDEDCHDDGGYRPVVRRPLTNIELARQALRQRNYSAALKHADAAVEQNPKDHDLQQFRSLALMAQGRYRESAAAGHNALARGPGWNWTTLRAMFASRAHYVEHYEALQLATRNNPENADLHFLLAYHCLMLGHVDAGRAELVKVVRIIPDEPVSVALLRMLPSNVASRD